MGDAEKKEWKLNDLVWAKMKGFAPWPGRIAEPTPEVRKLKKNGSQCIFFFGTNNYAWIEEPSIKPYLLFRDTLSKPAKITASFREALNAVKEYIENPTDFNAKINLLPPPPPPDFNQQFEKLRSSDLDESAEESVIASPKTPALNASTKSARPKSARKSGAVAPKRSSTFHQEEEQETPKRVKKATPAKVPASTSPKRNRTRPDTINNRFEDNGVDYTQRRTVAASNLLNRPDIPKPDSQEVDLSHVSDTLKSKNITASSLKFGFLGLGIMGCGIVKNLINSGHKVYVWNRTTTKIRKFLDAGAESVATPSDVVEMADITFSCVSDPGVCKEMVFGNCGITSGSNLNGKGYVEMTSIDTETSKDIYESLLMKGVRYLEAQIQGSKAQAEEGTLIILAAGDRSLFEECQTCFEAMGKNSFFLGDVGNATKMNLVLQTLAGVTIAGIAESLALADRAGLQQKDVLEVLELTQMASPMMLEKGTAIIKNDFKTHLPLTHLQKDLKLSLNMADSLEQPLPLTASANEVFKHAKRLGYSAHDASAVYVRARF